MDLGLNTRKAGSHSLVGGCSDQSLLPPRLKSRELSKRKTWIQMPDGTKRQIFNQ